MTKQPGRRRDNQTHTILELHHPQPASQPRDLQQQPFRPKIGPSSPLPTPSQQLRSGPLRSTAGLCLSSRRRIPARPLLRPNPSKTPSWVSSPLSHREAIAAGSRRLRIPEHPTLRPGRQRGRVCLSATIGSRPAVEPRPHTAPFLETVFGTLHLPIQAVRLDSARYGTATARLTPGGGNRA